MSGEKKPSLKDRLKPKLSDIEAGGLDEEWRVVMENGRVDTVRVLASFHDWYTAALEGRRGGADRPRAAIMSLYAGTTHDVAEIVAPGASTKSEEQEKFAASLALARGANESLAKLNSLADDRCCALQDEVHTLKQRVRDLEAGRSLAQVARDWVVRMVMR